MQPEFPLFDSELFDLARETRRVAESVADQAISVRLFEMADEVLTFSFLGDRTNKAQLSEALARFEANEDKCPMA